MMHTTPSTASSAATRITRARGPARHRVVVTADDAMPAAVIAEVLIAAFAMDPAAAASAAATLRAGGSIHTPATTHEIAETRASAASNAARARDHTLRCHLEAV